MSWYETKCLAFLSTPDLNNPGYVLFLCAPPEGGACSSWIKHGLTHSLSVQAYEAYGDNGLLPNRLFCGPGLGLLSQQQTHTGIREEEKNKVW